MIAYIPARGGSKRISGKNLRPLAGRPLLVYTIWTAQQSRHVTRVVVSTESEDVAAIARPLGAEVEVRSVCAARDGAADIEWLRPLVENEVGGLVVLRPTSPFRTAASVDRAIESFNLKVFSSLRTVSPARDHPYKMWTWGPGDGLEPLLRRATRSERMIDHGWSMPTQTLPRIWVQNAAIEVTMCGRVREEGTLSGERIQGMTLPRPEDVDLNTEEDWALAEAMIERGRWTVPESA